MGDGASGCSFDVVTIHIQRHVVYLLSVRRKPSLTSDKHSEQDGNVEFATLEWVWWFNHHRLLEPLGYVPPTEFHRSSETQVPEAALT